MATSVPISLARIDTPKTWTPEELELLNKNFFTIQELIKQGQIGFVGPQGPQGIAGVAGATGATGASFEAWPVGGVFISVVSTNPNTLLGYGTWSAIGAGRVLVGLNSGDTDFDVVEETGGAKTSTPSAHAGVTINDHGVTVSGPDTVLAGSGGATTVASNSHIHDVTVTTHVFTQPNTHAAMSIVQPYFVVYMWKRTA